MTADIATTITTREVAEVVLGVDRKAVESFVGTLPDGQLQAFVIRAEAFRAAVSFAVRAGEIEMAIRGFVGQRYTDPDTGTSYLFTDASRKKWKDIPGLVASLEEQGISVYEMLRSISEMRVTDLRGLCESRFLSGEQKAECLRIIEDFREDVKTAPGFVELDERGKIRR